MPAASAVTTISRPRDASFWAVSRAAPAPSSSLESGDFAERLESLELAFPCVFVATGFPLTLPLLLEGNWPRGHGTTPTLLGRVDGREESSLHRLFDGERCIHDVYNVQAGDSMCSSPSSFFTGASCLLRSALSSRKSRTSSDPSSILWI